MRRYAVCGAVDYMLVDKRPPYPSMVEGLGDFRHPNFLVVRA